MCSHSQSGIYTFYSRQLSSPAYLRGAGFINEGEVSDLGKDTLNIGGGGNAHLSLSQVEGWYGLLLHCILIGRNDDLWCLSTDASSTNSTMDLGLSALILTGRSGILPSVRTVAAAVITNWLFPPEEKEVVFGNSVRFAC